MEQDFNRITDEQLKNVTGGWRSGYGPGDACPNCGGKLVSTGIISGDNHQSQCTSCGETWLYQTYEYDGYGVGDACPVCGTPLKDAFHADGNVHFVRCPRCGERWAYQYI